MTYLPQSIVNIFLQKPSWAANNYVTQEIPRILRYLKSIAIVTETLYRPQLWCNWTRSTLPLFQSTLTYPNLFNDHFNIII